MLLRESYIWNRSYRKVLRVPPEHAKTEELMTTPAPVCTSERENDHESVPSDPDLALIVAHWPTLSEETRKAIAIAPNYEGKIPFKFTGDLKKVVIELGKSGLAAGDPKLLDDHCPRRRGTKVIARHQGLNPQRREPDC